MADNIRNGMTELHISSCTADEERPGWEKPCPRCLEPIRYTLLNLRGGVDLYLYCESSSDLVLVESRAVHTGQLSSRFRKDLEAIGNKYFYLESNLPSCGIKAHFRIWSNAKCPSCGYELPYNGGVKDESVRFYESKILWIEGATVFRLDGSPNNRLVRVYVTDAN